MDVKIDLAQYVNDVLIDTYVKVRGHVPSGGFIPDENTVSQLREAFKDKPVEKLEHFLRDAMFAHMSRTEITNTPFFVNTHLLAESSLAYMVKHRAYLRSFYGSGWEPRKFEQSVYGGVLQSEQDYLDMFGSYYLRTGKFIKDLTLLNPTVWWVIWSVHFKRLEFESCPETWLTKLVKHDGVRQTFEQAYSQEHHRLKDAARRQVAEHAAESAIRESALAWAGRQGAVHILYENDVATVATDSALPAALLECKTPLYDRDKALFQASRRALSKPEAPEREESNRPPKKARTSTAGLIELAGHAASIADT